MFNNPSLITRIGIGKLVGFLFGLAAFIFLPCFLPDASSLLRWDSYFGTPHLALLSVCLVCLPITPF